MSNVLTPSEREQALRNIVAQHQYQEIEGVLIDASTAGVVVAVLDHLTEESKARLLSFPIERVVSLTWALISRYSARHI